MRDILNKIIEPTNIMDKLFQSKCVRPLVFTNGCFDILHRGHVAYLQQARLLGDAMIVALNSDSSVKLLNKGDGRPMNSLENRMAIIASLEAVDYVTYFDAKTPLALILQIKPDILVKGGDWSVEQIVGYPEVCGYGGQVYSIPFIFDTSTTKLINKIRYG